MNHPERLTPFVCSNSGSKDGCCSDSWSHWYTVCVWSVCTYNQQQTNRSSARGYPKFSDWSVSRRWVHCRLPQAPIRSASRKVYSAVVLITTAYARHIAQSAIDYFRVLNCFPVKFQALGFLSFTSLAHPHRNPHSHQYPSKGILKMDVEWGKV